jgi:hypothetical protein
MLHPHLETAKFKAEIMKAKRKQEELTILKLKLSLVGLFLLSILVFTI